MKKQHIFACLLIVAITALIAMPAYATYQYDPDVRVNYPFNETSGDADDSTGNGFSVSSSLIYNVTRGVEGVYGNAYSFNGTSSYMVPNYWPMRTAPTYEPVTFSFWAKIPSGGGGTFFGAGAYGGQGYGSFQLRQDTFYHVWTPSIYVPSFGEIKAVDSRVQVSGLNLPADEWVHVAMHMDYGNPVADANYCPTNWTMWVNGRPVDHTFYNVYVASEPAAYVTSYYPNTVYNWNDSYPNTKYDYIGGRYVNNMIFYEGALDEISMLLGAKKTDEDIFRLYVMKHVRPDILDLPTRALYEAELQSMFEAALTGAGISDYAAYMGLMIDAALDAAEGTATVLWGDIEHYEPVLAGLGTVGDPYYFDFSGSNFSAMYWDWLTLTGGEYASLLEWYEEAVIADVIVGVSGEWVMKTGGVTGNTVPEPLTIFFVFAGLAFAVRKKVTFK